MALLNAFFIWYINFKIFFTVAPFTAHPNTAAVCTWRNSNWHNITAVWTFYLYHFASPSSIRTIERSPFAYCSSCSSCVYLIRYNAFRRTFDFEQDAAYIYAGFWQCYGFEYDVRVMRDVCSTLREYAEMGGEINALGLLFQ